MEGALIRRRTPADRALAYVRKLNAPEAKRKRGRAAVPLRHRNIRAEVEQAFREARKGET